MKTVFDRIYSISYCMSFQCFILIPFAYAGPKVHKIHLFLLSSSSFIDQLVFLELYASRNRTRKLHEIRNVYTCILWNHKNWLRRPKKNYIK